MSGEVSPGYAVEKGGGSSALDFIYSTHSPENLSKIVDALIQSDGDTIAIEKISKDAFGTGTAEEKSSFPNE